MTATDQRSQPRFDWFVPIDGDGEHIGTLRAERPPTFEYLREVATAAEELGYHPAFEGEDRAGVGRAS